MKRIVQRLFVTLTILALLSCGHMTIITGGPESPVLDRVKKAGELRVGMTGNQPPFNMTTQEGDIIGFEVDLAERIAGAMGVSLKTVTMPFSELLPALENGRVDMVLSSLTITPERNLKVAFVGPYFISGKSVLTKIRTLAEADGAAELNSPDVRLVVLKGSTSQAFVDEVLPRTTRLLANSYDEAINLVLEDKVHAMFADYPICLISLLRHPGSGLVSVVMPLTYEPIGIALPAGDPLLVNWMENFMAALDGSGGLDKIEIKWLENGSWIKRLP